MVTLADVKLNGEYEYIRAVDPTAAEDSAAGFLGGQTWLTTTDGGSFQLTDPDAGTWTPIEESLDAKANAMLRTTQLRLFRATSEYFYRYRQTSLLSSDLSDDLELSRFSFRTLTNFNSAFASWAVDQAAKTLVSTDISGEITDIAVGDVIQIRDSRRNDNLYTVTAVDATTITVSESTLVDETADKFIVIPVNPSDEFFQIIGRMIWYDVTLRNARGGLGSERIGSYSYTQGDMIGGLEYPKDIAAGFSQYLSAAPIGLADLVP